LLRKNCCLITDRHNTSLAPGRAQAQLGVPFVFELADYLRSHAPDLEPREPGSGHIETLGHGARCQDHGLSPYTERSSIWALPVFFVTHRAVESSVFRPDLPARRKR